MGDHTDYTGGLALPMAVDRWTEIRGEPLDGRIVLQSKDEPVDVDVTLPIGDPAEVDPPWGRYVAAVAAELGGPGGIDVQGLRGMIATSIPVGAGLSSSAALEVAVALALGHGGDALDLAERCQRAEHRATGVPTGIMDQLCIASAVDDHAVLIDCRSLDALPVVIPEGVDVIVRFVAHRTLGGTGYADRVWECRAAESFVGPLRDASTADLERIDDPMVRARARHVITENQRVLDTVEALAAGDHAAVGAMMKASHRSLRDDFDVSTDAIDRAIADLVTTPGVHGARLTGGGFGGCVVAWCEPGVVTDGWLVRPVGAAHRFDAI